MLNKKWRNKLSATMVSTLLASLVLPTNVSWADTTSQSTGNQAPVQSTLPSANATVVRPDTQIKVQLDPQNSHYADWSKKYQDQNLTLALLTDGGESVFDKTNSNLTFDPATGVLTFTPPSSLNRYTTYGVVVGKELPGWLKPKNKTLKANQLPDNPQLQTQAVVPSTLLSPTSKPTAGTVQSDSLLMTANGPAQASQDTQNLDPSTLVASGQGGTSAAAQTASAAIPSDARYIGPKPVKLIHTDWQPIDVKDGDDQKGVIESIQGSTITLFGGQQFTVNSDTQIHVPQQSQSTINNLHSGDFVEVTLNAQSQVQNVNVINQQELVSYVFTTGSDLHEPTHVTVQEQNQQPRVTEDGHFTLVSTDDYGLPAWGSQTSINLITTDKSPLDTSAAVLPSASFTTNDPSGSTDVTVVDHKPQHVAAEISMNGPNQDGQDAHGLLATFDFRPGLPAKVTLQAPDKMEVGTTEGISGTVTDVYDNLVENGSELDLAASDGTIQSPIYTENGQYLAGYTAATKVQDINLSIRSAEGNAMNYGTIHLFPGDPASMTLNAPQQVQAGDTAQISGDVYDQYGNTVLDGSVLKFTASAVQVPADTTTTNGHYEFDFTAPTKVQTVDVAGISEIGTASADSKVQIIPGPPAILSLQAKNAYLNTQDTTDLSGQVADQYDNVIDNQAIALQAQHGTLSNNSPLSDTSGWYTTTYTAPFYNGVDTVSATAGSANASVDLNISSAGTGINPTTGQVEKVASIKFDQTSYNVSPNQVTNLTGHIYDANGQPLEDVIFSGSSASAGTITGLSYQTDAKGAFTLTYQTPSSQATATVTVSSNQISGTATITTQAYGYGYNPTKKIWEPVGYLTVDVNNFKTITTNSVMSPSVMTPQVTANYSYNVSLLPNTTVQFSGHAYDSTGQPLSQVQFDTLTATGGTVSAATATDSTGAFTVNYQTTSTTSNQVVQIGTGNAFATINAFIMNPGQGYNPVTGQMEDIAHITFNPNSYNTTPGGMLTITGNVTNSSGQTLRLAKVSISVNGGSTVSQVITDINGAFSMTYYAPSTAGTYTITGSVNNTTYGQVTGTGTITVTAPTPPYFLNPTLYIQGYDYPYVYYSGTVMDGKGSYMSQYEEILNNYAVCVEETFGPAPGYMYTNDFIRLDSTGKFSGAQPAYYDYTWYSYDRYGTTKYESFHYDLCIYQKINYNWTDICKYFYTAKAEYYYPNYSYTY